MELLHSIRQYIFTGQARSIRTKLNIVYSFGIKIFNVVVNLLYVPLLTDYLGVEEYGIWLILTSIVSWFSFFDIGIGNGLRNKFAEAKAEGNTELARTYVSTAYASITVIFLSVGVITGFIIPFVNWNSVFNTNAMQGSQLVPVVLVVFAFFIFRFIAQLISVILLADQRTALSGSFSLLSNIVVLVIIFLLKQFYDSSLFVLSIFLSGVPVIILMAATVFFFKRDYYQYRPGLAYVNLKYAKPLFNLGLKFLIIQVSTVIFMSATNFIIAQFYSPKDVAVYNIAFKYFSLVIMIWGIIQTPMWSAITDAYQVDDLPWIKSLMKKMKILAAGGVVIIAVMLLSADMVYYYWLGGKIHVPFSLSVVLAADTLVFVFFSPYALFLNGVSKIHLNTILVIFQSLIYIPLAYYFAKSLQIGLAGIVLAALVCELPLRISQPVQYSKIINKTARGVWDK
jgi:O-antigen/teichoic acid export membrane protein